MIIDENIKVCWTEYIFHPWWNYTNAASGCTSCYTTSTVAGTNYNNWGANKNSGRAKRNNWREVEYWNERAEAEIRRYRVFCGCMMDWCDKDIPASAVRDLFALIRSTPMLDWQLLTRHASLIKDRLPADWGDGYNNVWLGVTVDNMNHGYPRTDALRGVPAKVKFICAEPLLENLDKVSPYLAGIDLVMIGDSAKYNPIQESWVKNLLRECQLKGLPVCFKK